MTVTFATPIENNPCEHDWEYESGNWCGSNYECIYCHEQKYIKNEPVMMNC